MTETRPGYAEDVDPLLVQLAERFENNRRYMASVMAMHRRQEGKSVTAQQAQLGVGPLGYVRLALCYRPQGEADDFRAQVEKVARYSGADPAAMVQMIRLVDAVESMEPRTVSAEADGASAHARSAMTVFAPLAAARDRLSEPHEEYRAPSTDTSAPADAIDPSIDPSIPQEARNENPSDPSTQPPETPDSMA
jgi:hypothetical protein